jgi:hypothetical protein
MAGGRVLDELKADIDEIRSLLARGAYDLSRHALRRTVERNIGADMIRAAGARAEVVEDYPGDKYTPSCLLLGFARGVPLHLHVSRRYTTSVRIITAYVPRAEDWLPGFKVRRP